MADPLYTHGKLGEAVQALATGRGRINERLREATGHLAGVDENVFSVSGVHLDARAFWRRIQEAITSAKTVDPKRGLNATSIDDMTEEEASDVAQFIVSLDAMLGSYLEDRRRD